MRVLLTGHKGYIGTVLGPMLEQAGHDVHGLDSDLYRRSSFGSEPRHFQETIKDIRDVEKSDLKGFDAVLHLAGLSNDPLGDLDPDLTYDINFRASVRLAEMAKEVGVPRFIFSSSCSNYGAAGDDVLTEESELNPVTPYGKSKVMVEKELTKLASSTFSPVYLRNATAYGVSPRLRFDLVLNNLVAWAFTTGKVHLKSDGSPWRPLVHIEDISRAFLTVLNAPKEKVHARAFNVGVAGENFRIRDVAAIVRDTVLGSELSFADGASPDKRNYRVDCSLLPRELPEFCTKWTVMTGAEELLDAYQRTGLELSEFEGKRYKRIDHIRTLIEEGVLDTKLRHTGRNWQ